MLGKKALETSNEALRLARETMQMPQDIKRDIEDLKKRYIQPLALYDRTKFFANKALNMSTEAYNEALDLYSQAVSLQQLVLEADIIKKEAAQPVRRGCHSREEVQKLLDSGITHQQGKLKYPPTSEEAISRIALPTVGSPNNRLFRTKVPEIEANIREAEARTQEARDALSGAGSDAAEALRIAQEAEKMAQGASDEASRIRQDAGQTKQKAEKLLDDADQLDKDVSDSKEQVDNLKLKADTDRDQTDNALQKAGAAKQSAKEAADRVADALAKVENISQILSTLRDLDTAELDRLETELAAAEAVLQNADLEAQFAKLTTANNQLKVWVQEYSQDLSELEKDVQNVKDIMDSLPTGCFKNIDIETPTAQ
ncbi:hypothetical protein DPMN_151540 [Dreissena polymorpha]|uniref:Laminin subunit gamma-1 n=1 Tax=Dreissena polymorpha TaxID=45954 RepID=A0A9D4FFS6_DREPO|nr:hypothetical protein DPMN_151540 [Dreissena polymorpha]